MENKRTYSNIIKKCPILYQNKNKSPLYSCMFWGIECPITWYNVIEKLSLSLETLNKKYKKHRIYIAANQVKEKYGTLCFYATARTYENKWKSLLTWLPDKIINLIWKFRKYKGKEFLAKYIASPLCRLVVWVNSPSKRITNLRGEIGEEADKLIIQAEEECYCICEECGKKIGTKESPRCETQGWIRYICKECAEKNNKIYKIVNGSLYSDEPFEEF